MDAGGGRDAVTLPGGCPPALPPPRLRVAAQKVGCWRPGFWVVPHLLLVAAFMRGARRHWLVPPPVLREGLARGEASLRTGSAAWGGAGCVGRAGTSSCGHAWRWAPLC